MEKPSPDGRWLGDDRLQFYTQADVVDRFRVRVKRNIRGVDVWHYYGVPAEVVVVLASLWNEQQGATT